MFYGWRIMAWLHIYLLSAGRVYMYYVQNIQYLVFFGTIPTALYKSWLNPPRQNQWTPYGPFPQYTQVVKKNYHTFPSPGFRSVGANLADFTLN